MMKCRISFVIWWVEFFCWFMIIIVYVAAWSYGLQTGHSSASLLCMQQERGAGCKLSPRPFGWVWERGWRRPWLILMGVCCWILPLPFDILHLYTACQKRICVQNLSSKWEMVMSISCRHGIYILNGQEINLCSSYVQPFNNFILKVNNFIHK